MILVDVHAHLDNEEFNKDLPSILSHEGLAAVVCNGVDTASNRQVLELCKKYKNLKAALGIYPTHCLKMIESNPSSFEKEINFIDDNISSGNAIAIGEVGLEYQEVENLDDKNKGIMNDCLKKFLDISKKHDVPIIIHSRKAELETIDFLEKNNMKGKKVIMHCFSGRKHLVKRIIDNGWIFSIPCNIIRSEHFQNIVKETPIKQLLTETDAPYLSPIAGERNDPRNIIYAIKKIAEIKGLSEEDTANMIFQNYQEVFL